jgi:hypothetical protein
VDSENEDAVLPILSSTISKLSSANPLVTYSINISIQTQGNEVPLLVQASHAVSLDIIHNDVMFYTLPSWIIPN